MPSALIPFYLVRERCYRCEGAGTLPFWRKEPRPCVCLCRAAFRACVARRREAAEPALRHKAFAREAEYRADLELIVKRALPAERYDQLHAVWFDDTGKRASRRRSLDALRPYQRYQLLRRLEAEAGKALLEAMPHSAFPPDAYFSGLIQRVQVTTKKLGVFVGPRPTSSRSTLRYDA